MAMHEFPHHPHNHPNSANDSSPTAPHEAKKKALLTLIPKLLEAQSLIAQSKARPPLSDDERIAVLPSTEQLPKMAPRRRRPRRLELRDEGCADAISSAGRERGVEIPANVDANMDVEAQAQVQEPPAAARQHRFLKFWYSMGWREKAVVEVTLLICITTACVVPFVIIYARRAGDL